MTSLNYALFNTFNATCSSTTLTVNDPDTQVIPNETGISNIVQPTKSYVIRIIKSGFDDSLPSSNYQPKYNQPFFFTINGVSNINSLDKNLIIESYVSNVNTYILNNQENKWDISPIVNTYKPISFVKSNANSNANANNNNLCRTGHYAKAFDASSNDLSKALTITCDNDEIIATGLTSNDTTPVTGFVLRVYPKSFFTTPESYINNPANGLVYQEVGITNFSSFRIAIGNFGTKNLVLNDYMYEWTATLSSTINTQPNVNFMFKSIDTPGKFFYNSNESYNALNNVPLMTEVGNGALLQTQKNSHCIQPNPIDPPTSNGAEVIQNPTHVLYKFTSKTTANKITFFGKVECDILLVGGGGGGGGDIGGGGGGGEVIYQEKVIFNRGDYNIIVGSGGSGSSSSSKSGEYNTSKGGDGTSSIIYKNNSEVFRKANGGGGGGCANRGNSGIDGNNGNGGSGGGGGSVWGNSTINNSNGGFGRNRGANGIYNRTLNYLQGGGGGGAGGSGLDNKGGNGLLINIEGTSKEYGAGGGGGSKGITISNNGGGQSEIIGGNGSYSRCLSSACADESKILKFEGSGTGTQIIPNKNGKTNTGSGGGGGGFNDYPNINNGGGYGADGIVIIRIKKENTIEGFGVDTTTVYNFPYLVQQFPPKPKNNKYDWTGGLYIKNKLVL